MGRYSDIRSALDSKLNSLSGLPSVAWENTKFDPTEGSTFLRPTVIPVISTMSGLNGQQKNEGIYLVEIFVDKGNGSKDLLELVDDIYDHFRSTTSLTANSTKVYIQAIERSPTRIEGSWAICSVDISFFSYST